MVIIGKYSITFEIIPKVIFNLNGTTNITVVWYRGHQGSLNPLEPHAWVTSLTCMIYRYIYIHMYIHHAFRPCVTIMSGCRTTHGPHTFLFQVFQISYFYFILYLCIFFFLTFIFFQTSASEYFLWAILRMRIFDASLI